MGEERAAAYGARNGVPGELVVRLRPERRHLGRGAGGLTATTTPPGSVQRHMAAPDRLGRHQLLELAPDELLRQARAVRDGRPRDEGHLLPEGVHPADDAVPGQMRLLHVRQGAGPPRRALPDARPGAAHRPAGRRSRLPRGAVHPRASGPRSATRWPAPGWTSTVTARPSTTWRRCAAWCSTRPGCCPTPTPALFFPTSWPSCAPSPPARG